MDKNSLDCVAQDVHSSLCLATYGLQDVVMRCDTTSELGEGLTYVIDEEEMNAIWGVLDVIRSARDRLHEALEQV